MKKLLSAKLFFLYILCYSIVSSFFSSCISHNDSKKLSESEAKMVGKLLTIEVDGKKVPGSIEVDIDLGEFDDIDGFVKKLPSSINVGEETGALDQMLVSIADQMDYDSEIATEKLVAMIEPLMIVVMAVMVGFIMIAIIQPIYGSYQSIADTTM